MLLSIKFYGLFISMILGKALIMSGAIIVFILYLLNIVYFKSKDVEKGFSIPVFLIFISLIISTFAASYFYDQSLFSTLISQFDLYLFLFYFLLHKMKPKPEDLTNMIVIIGLIYCLIYFIQFAVYPKVIVICSMFKDRGTLRIFMPGIGSMVSAYYILLSRFIASKKPKFILLLMPTVVVLFLLGTRQALGIVALMTILMILFSKKIKSKFLIFVLIFICILPVFLIFQEIYYNMFNVSKTQSAHFQDYVRVKAAQYYLFNFNHNPIWMLVGNGMPAGQSSYAIAIERLQKTTGYYLNDLGLIGDFFRYGALYAVVIVYILFRLARIKLDEKFSFIRYNAITDILAIFVGSGMQSQTIVLLCMSFYIADINRKEIALGKKAIIDQVANNKS